MHYPSEIGRSSCLGFITLLVLLLSGSVGATAQTSWLPVPPPTGRNLRAVFLADTLRAFAGGDSGIVLSTADGGASWTTLRGADSLQVRDIFMLNTARAWAASWRRLINPGDWNGSLLHATTDGGATWSALQDSGRFYNTLFFHDSLDGWLGGEGGLIRGTTDGGVTWFEPVIESTVYSVFPVNRIRFYSRAYGIAVGGYPESAGVIWKTVDGGATWSVTGLGDALRAIHFVDSLHVILTGGGFDDGACMTRTTDGGASWSFSYVGPFGFATAMSFRTPSEGWAPLGFTGTSMVTRDAGGSWQEVLNDGMRPTYGVHFAGPRHGLMVGDSGKVLRFNPPAMVGTGAGWNVVSLPVATGQSLKDSLFPSAVSPAYRFIPGGGYAPEDTLFPGRGYWLKFASAGATELQGLPRLSDSVAVEEGWNMVGSLSVPVAASSVATDPPGILLSPFYGFGAGYSAAAVLEPGKGYWVKVATPGVLVFEGE